MPYLSRLKYLPLAALLAASMAGCDAAPDPMEAVPLVEETVLRADLLKDAVRDALHQTTVHLNNYGSEDEEREHSWYLSNDSYVQLGALLGKGTFRFDIPESRSKAGPFRLLYYVQDLNVRNDSIAVQVVPDASELIFSVRLPFEDEKAEFKGHCLSETFGRVGACLGSKDRIAPDIEFEEAGLEILVRPVMEAGSLSLEAASVQFEGTIQAGGLCNIDLGLFAFDVCDALANYQNTLQGELEQLVYEGVNDPAVRSEIAAGLRPILDTLGIGDIVFLQRTGDDLVVGHRPRQHALR